MSAITAYLSALKRSLWMSAARRQSTIDEMQDHLTSLEEEQGRPFDSIAEIAQRFGAPGDVGCDLNRSIPWYQSRAPWWLFAIWPCTFVLLNGTMYVVHAFFPGDGTGDFIMSRARSMAQDGAFQLYEIVIMFLIIFLALRRGLRPFLIIAAICLPQVIVKVLHTYSMITAPYHRPISLVGLLLGNGGFLTTYVISVLALIALAQVWRTTSLYRALVTWGLVLAGSQAFTVALALSLRGQMSTRQLPIDCIGMVFSAAVAVILGRALLHRRLVPSQS